MYTLVYFPFAGRAGAIRDVLTMGKIPFEDQRLSFDDFVRGRARGDFPHEVLPILITSNGTRISQSNTILRLVSKQAGFYPEDQDAGFLMEAFIDMIEDYASRLSVSIREQDPQIRAQLRQGLNDQWFPQFLTIVEQQLSGEESEWLFGGKLTAADLKAYHFIEKLCNGSLDGISTNLLENFISVQRWFAHTSRVRSEHSL